MTEIIPVAVTKQNVTEAKAKYFTDFNIRLMEKKIVDLVLQDKSMKKHYIKDANKLIKSVQTWLSESNDTDPEEYPLYDYATIGSMFHCHIVIRKHSGIGSGYLENAVPKYIKAILLGINPTILHQISTEINSVPERYRCHAYFLSDMLDEVNQQVYARLLNDAGYKVRINNMNKTYITLSL